MHGGTGDGGKRLRELRSELLQKSHRDVEGCDGPFGLAPLDPLADLVLFSYRRISLHGEVGGELGGVVAWEAMVECVEMFVYRIGSVLSRQVVDAR